MINPVHGREQGWQSGEGTIAHSHPLVDPGGRTDLIVTHRMVVPLLYRPGTSIPRLTTRMGLPTLHREATAETRGVTKATVGMRNWAGTGEPVTAYDYNQRGALAVAMHVRSTMVRWFICVSTHV